MAPHRADPRAAASSPEGRALSEFRLIAEIRERLARAGAAGPTDALPLASGDDAAISAAAGARATSVDAIVEGVHFRIPPFTAAQAGAKGLAVALSDLAAMGAEAAEAYVQLGLPAGREREALELAEGIAELAGRHGVTVAGGDITRSPVLFLAFTAVGTAAEPGALITRSGARPGELVVVTGELGGAGAGLLLCERPELAAAVPEPVAEALRARQLEPAPQLEAGRLLAAHGASAMIDLSDGLAGDAAHVAAAAGVALAVELERLPIAAGFEAVAAAAEAEPLRLAVEAGEDYELLATIAPERFEAAAEQALSAGLRLTVIGAVGRGEGVELRLPGGAGTLLATGFDQLADRPGLDGPA